MTTIQRLTFALATAEAAMKSARSDWQMVKAMNDVARLRREIRICDANN